MADIDPAPRSGEVVGGKYILGECIGEGGMGLVFLAEHPSQRRTVAIKLLPPALTSSATFVRRFHTEAVAASRVRHPGTVGIIDYGTSDGGAPFIAMEYVPGRPLSAVIEEEEISLSRALEIVRQLLCTLKAAHDSGVVHADLKSDNIIVETTADGDAITLIDFGLARVDGRWDPGWETGCVSGTPAYMAPELVRGEPPTVAADLYGVGVILYELLTGRTPFEGGRLEEVLQRQLEDDPLPPSQLRPGRGIPEVLDRCVLRALHKDPAERFTSAVELLRVLSVARRALGEPLDLASSGDEPRGLRERVAEVRPRPALRTSDAPTSLDLPHVRHRELRRAS